MTVPDTVAVGDDVKLGMNGVSLPVTVAVADAVTLGTSGVSVPVVVAVPVEVDKTVEDEPAVPDGVALGAKGVVVAVTLGTNGVSVAVVVMVAVAVTVVAGSDVGEMLGVADTVALGRNGVSVAVPISVALVETVELDDAVALGTKRVAVPVAVAELLDMEVTVTEIVGEALDVSDPVVENVAVEVKLGGESVMVSEGGELGSGVAVREVVGKGVGVRAAVEVFEGATGVAVLVKTGVEVGGWLVVVQPSGQRTRPVIRKAPAATPLCSLNI